MQSEPITRADRIAFTNLFKEIAAIGRQARERCATEKEDVQLTPDTSHLQPVFEKEVPAG